MRKFFRKKEQIDFVVYIPYEATEPKKFEKLLKKLDDLTRERPHTKVTIICGHPC